MYSITEDQLNFMLDDIKARGIVLEDLQDNLLDHICCVIENEMPESADFYKFYEQILPKFFKRKLSEIQEETDNLLTFKNYYAMKKTLNISGIAAAVITLAGAMFKTFHWPGAGIMLVTGGVLFSLIFLPLLIALKFKDEDQKTDKWVFTIGLLIGIGMTLGVIFKLMHWPGADFLMRWSLTAFVFGYVPLYFVTRIRRPEIKFNTTVNAVLMMACGGMLYALFNLGYSHHVRESLYAAHLYLDHNTNEIYTGNNQLFESLEDKEQVNSFHKKSIELYDKIEDIKINLISKVEHVSVEEAKKINIKEMENPKDHRVIEHYFSGIKGELSQEDLEKEINDYNVMIKSIKPGNKQKIAIEKLRLDKTLISVLLNELTQIQLVVAINDNGHLNYYLGKSD